MSEGSGGPRISLDEIDLAISPVAEDGRSAQQVHRAAEGGPWDRAGPDSPPISHQRVPSLSVGSAGDAIQPIDSESTHGSKESGVESAMLEKSIITSFDPPRRRTRVWWILAFYIPLLVLPWTCTCIMNYRPLIASFYVDKTGWNTPRTFDINERFQLAINVMNAIAAVLTLPVTSVMLAEASIVWMQREDGHRLRLSLAQFFDVADRAWMDIRTVWSEIGRAMNNEAHNAFIVKSALFVVLCASILPLQQLLVRTETIRTVTCQDLPLSAYDTGNHSVPKSCYDYTYIQKAIDAKVGLMKNLPLWDIKEVVKMHLAADTGSEQQLRMWSLDQAGSYNFSLGRLNQAYNAYGGAFGGTLPFWVAAVPNGTTTGVISEHALRLNSSVSCERMGYDAIPEVCPGPRPLETNFTRSIPESSYWQSGPEYDYRIRVCVPGNISASPWDNSRDARTIHEEAYFGLQVSNYTYQSVDTFLGATFGVRCVVNTTRGYFELGNAFNDFTPQPLLEKYPRGKETEQYNDLAYSLYEPSRMGPTYYRSKIPFNLKYQLRTSQ